ncbi:hypothetical protein Ark11_0978 [Candidatus Ichthyocystis hellenicum]|uniref:Uncharacterized protein n=1 Tax=Candidatus Ichthyocystis hellenicum TaxID=1561003 RepID=A0A0S4M1Z4_9BURK|nr:hypothetical protein Ark11_0978 [Candidatus Ichthyocystis hellenicum]
MHSFLTAVVLNNVSRGTVMIDLDFILSLKSDISDSKKKLIEIWNYL